MGTEPVAETRQTLELPRRPRILNPGILLRVRGRAIRLRGLRRPPTGLLYWLTILGPGLIAGAVGDDAGGIATYSQAGAKYGYDLLWVILLITASLIVVQEMSARLGAATGRGLLGLIRSEYGIRWASFAAFIVLLANFGMVLGEFVGISSAMALFGVSRWISVGTAALVVSYLVVAGNYNQFEKVFVAMAMVFLAYVVSAVLAHPNLGDVARGLFVPVIHADPAYTALVIALIGTTISPYQQVFQQSAVVEKGIPRSRYPAERKDTIAGMVFSNVISMFIIIATAATLHVSGTFNIDTAADAANALKPLAGNAAFALFAIGIVGASLMAASVVSLSTSFAFTEAFGFQQGISLEMRSAPVFYGLFLAQIIAAGAIAVIPGLPTIQLLIGVQVLNGVLFPILLTFILLLSNSRRHMGELKNTLPSNVLGWGTLAFTGLAILIGLIQQVAQALGLHLFGG
jgi:NRAMP (natural resistance-associated macrophage protein)-like metal ion transporter